jgi:hypothetical protein
MPRIEATVRSGDAPVASTDRKLLAEELRAVGLARFLAVPGSAPAYGISE